MDKRTRSVSILLGLAILTIIVIEVIRPTPLNWRPSYTSFDKDPFGAYILKEELQRNYGVDNLTIIKRNPFEFLIDSTNKNNSKKATYIFINPSVNIDKQVYHELVSFVDKGNNVFISSNYFGSYFTDSLKVITDTQYQLLEEEVTPNFFSQQAYLSQPPSLKKGIYKTIFKSFDTLKTKALGYFEEKHKDTIMPLDSLAANTNKIEKEINFIQIQQGKGSLFLHTLPEVFSNFYVLKNNSYAATSLSLALDMHQIYWDDYYKAGRKVVDSPMRFVLDQASLKWAYYLLLFGLFVFIIYRGKREQRIIEVRPPLENSTIAFTQTIGDLYFQQKEYSAIISKKITYFFEKIRSTYHLPTDDLSQRFVEKLAAKTNHSFEETQQLISLIQIIKNKQVPTEQDLIKLHQKMNNFSL